MKKLVLVISLFFVVNNMQATLDPWYERYISTPDNVYFHIDRIVDAADNLGHLEIQDNVDYLLNKLVGEEARKDLDEKDLSSALTLISLIKMGDNEIISELLEVMNFKDPILRMAADLASSKGKDVVAGMLLKNIKPEEKE